MSECDLLGKLLAVWEMMDEDAQFDLLDHARWIVGDSHLIGGPVDGLRIPDRFKNESAVSIEVEGKAAVYERDDSMMLRFSHLSRIGGEGGEWPNIKADELRRLKGGAQ